MVTEFSAKVSTVVDSTHSVLYLLETVHVCGLAT